MQNDSEDAPEELMPKTGAVSAVWTSFGLKKCEADQVVNIAQLVKPHFLPLMVTLADY